MRLLFLMLLITNLAIGAEKPKPLVPAFGDPSVSGFFVEPPKEKPKEVKKETKPKEEPKIKEKPKESVKIRFRAKTNRERLSPKLPDWFFEKSDEDGQVTLFNFMEKWTDNEITEFMTYDLNDDGIITPEECLKVEKEKAKNKKTRTK